MLADNYTPPSAPLSPELHEEFCTQVEHVGADLRRLSSELNKLSPNGTMPLRAQQALDALQLLYLELGAHQ